METDLEFLHGSRIGRVGEPRIRATTLYPDTICKNDPIPVAAPHPRGIKQIRAASALVHEFGQSNTRLRGSCLRFLDSVSCRDI
jgi:hypothetical protein